MATSGWSEVALYSDEDPYRGGKRRFAAQNIQPVSGGGMAAPPPPSQAPPPTPPPTAPTPRLRSIEEHIKSAIGRIHHKRPPPSPPPPSSGGGGGGPPPSSGQTALTASPFSGALAGLGPLSVNFNPNPDPTKALPSDAAFTWDFGDGTSSTSALPSHTYSNPGTYTPKLTLKSAILSDSKSFTLAPISVIGAAPAASMTQGKTPFTVKFDHKGVALPSDVRFLWDFGDGTAASTEALPSHTYTRGGTFTPKLTLSTAKGLFTKVFLLPSIFVTFVGEILASPKLHIQGGGNGGTEVPVTVKGIHGIDPSKLPPDLTFLWTWGDGTTDTSPTPSHTYAEPSIQPQRGTVYSASNIPTYKTKLHLESALWNQFKDFVLDEVKAFPAFDALPQFSQGSATAPSYVSFNGGTTVNPTVWSKFAGLGLHWDFGDGSNPPEATDLNPTHVYEKAGTFTPTLTIKSGISQVLRLFHLPPITVGQGLLRDITANPTADKTTTDTNTPVNLQHNISMVDGGAIVDDLSFAWDFGDASPTDGSQSPNHTYANPGTYTVGLKVGSILAAVSKVFKSLTIIVKAPVEGLFAKPGAKGPSDVRQIGSTDGQDPQNEDGSPFQQPDGEPGDIFSFAHGFQGLGGGAGALFEASISGHHFRHRIRKHLHLGGAKFEVTSPGNVVSIKWDHGDGTTHESSGEGPSHDHTFAAEGNFIPKVTISVKDPIGGRTFSHTIDFGKDLQLLFKVFRIPHRVDVRHDHGRWEGLVSDRHGNPMPNIHVAWIHYAPIPVPDHKGKAVTDNDGKVYASWGDTGVVGGPVPPSRIVWYPFRNPLAKGEDKA